MFKQLLIVKKGHPVPSEGDVSQDLFFKLFEKPLLLIAMENALALIQKQEVTVNSSGEKIVTISRPEEDTSAAGMTLTGIEF